MFDKTMEAGVPWFKVDDSFATHPKRTQSDRNAIGLWVVAGSWCAQQMTDGFVPVHVLPLLGGRKRDANELVRVGLWEEKDGGWLFHDWLDYQPSRTQIMAGRASDARRQGLFRNPELRSAIRRRDGDSCRYCGITVRWSDRRGPQGGTYDHVDPEGPNAMENLVVACRACSSAKAGRTPAKAGMDLIPVSKSDLVTDPDRDLVSSRPPTRPDPLVPNGTSKEGGALTSDSDKADGAKKRGTRLPETWQPTPEDVAWARDEGLADGWVRQQTAQFCDYWHAESGAKASKRDWSRAWKVWLRRDAARSAGNGRTPMTPTEKAAGWLTVDFEDDATQRIELERRHR